MYILDDHVRFAWRLGSEDAIKVIEAPMVAINVPNVAMKGQFIFGWKKQASFFGRPTFVLGVLACI